MPADKLPCRAEYRHLLDELGAQLNNPEEQELKKRLAKLKEDDQQQDIAYLANKTGERVYRNRGKSLGTGIFPLPKATRGRGWPGVGKWQLRTEGS